MFGYELVKGGQGWLAVAVLAVASLLFLIGTKIYAKQQKKSVHVPQKKRSDSYRWTKWKD